MHAHCTLHLQCVKCKQGRCVHFQCVQCRMEVDEVCTGSPVSMDGVVMDSVTSASYSALRCARFVSNMCTRLTIIHVFFMLHSDVCISCIFSITVFLHNSIIMPATVNRLVDITVGLSTSI